VSGKQSKLLVFWAVLFVLSLFFIFGSLDTSPYTISFPPIDSQEPTGEPESGELVEEADFNWSLAVAIVTAVASAGGFIATTLFALREDRREAAMHNLQIESLKREIAHKDLEIARLWQQQRQHDRS
jgi:hypothetical protein